MISKRMTHHPNPNWTQKSSPIHSKVLKFYFSQCNSIVDVFLVHFSLLHRQMLPFVSPDLLFEQIVEDFQFKVLSHGVDRLIGDIWNVWDAWKFIFLKWEINNQICLNQDGLNGKASSPRNWSMQMENALRWYHAKYQDTHSKFHE